VRCVALPLVYEVVQQHDAIAQEGHPGHRHRGRCGYQNVRRTPQDQFAHIRKRLSNIHIHFDNDCGVWLQDVHATKVNRAGGRPVCHSSQLWPTTTANPLNWMLVDRSRGPCDRLHFIGFAQSAHSKFNSQDTCAIVPRQDFVYFLSV